MKGYTLYDESHAQLAGGEHVTVVRERRERGLPVTIVAVNVQDVFDFARKLVAYVDYLRSETIYLSRSREEEDVGDILDRLHRAGDDAVERGVDGGIDQVIAHGEELISSLPEDLGPRDEVAELGREALRTLEQVRGPATRLGQRGLAIVVGHLENDDEEAAKREYISSKATFLERRAYQKAATQGTYDEAKEREESWEVIKDVLKTLGKKTLKILGYLALGALGIG